MPAHVKHLEWTSHVFVIFERRIFSERHNSNFAASGLEQQLLWFPLFFLASVRSNQDRKGRMKYSAHLHNVPLVFKFQVCRRPNDTGSGMTFDRTIFSNRTAMHTHLRKQRVAWTPPTFICHEPCSRTTAAPITAYRLQKQCNRARAKWFSERQRKAEPAASGQNIYGTQRIPQHQLTRRF